ncbi:MAG: hypothetical protein ACOVOV_01275 [Dolichospermum sp.]
MEYKMKFHLMNESSYGKPYSIEEAAKKCLDIEAAMNKIEDHEKVPFTELAVDFSSSNLNLKKE